MLFYLPKDGVLAQARFTDFRKIKEYVKEIKNFDFLKISKKF